MASEVRRTGFGGKSNDVTQGDLIVPTSEVVTFGQGREGQDKVMDGEKSDVGIVARKLAGKAAMASETTPKSSLQAPTQKAGTCAKPETKEEERLW
jgi:hypothetical protein